MADFPTATKVWAFNAGNNVFGCYKLTGDGSGTTFNAPCGRVDAAWASNVDNTTPLDIVSHSGNTITVTADSSGAVASGKFVHVFFVGSD